MTDLAKQPLIDRVYGAMAAFNAHREPLSLSMLARDVEAHEGEVIEALQELKRSGRIVFAGRSGSVPQLTVIEGGP